MADRDGAARADPPLRPTISLPPRSSYESLFRGGGGGGAADASPGPMTLVSSFFSEDHESDCRSFSQLLAGAMSPPAAAPQIAEGPAEMRDMGGGGGGGGGGMVRQSRPLGLMVSPQPSFFTIPAGLSPASLLESPAAFFSPTTGHFGISHQQALAQVTAQAAHAHSHVHTEHQSTLSAATAASMTQPTSSGINMSLLQEMPLRTSDTNNATSESAEDAHCDRRSQPTAFVVEKPAADGYNWRKYGQKQVKGSEYPRSYYKCTHPSCPVKKKVERSLDGHVTEIIYKGQHNHQLPAPKRSRECDTLTSSNDINGNLDSEAISQGGSGNFNRSGNSVTALTYKRERESGHGTSEQLSGSSDGEEVGDTELVADEGDYTEPDAKRRNINNKIMESMSSQKTVTEARIIVQTTSEVDLLDDGYRWRKYGQKVVKGNPHPRSYYKCTSAGCNVRKHVERASTDSKAVITTYEGKHNHAVPAARNSSHNTASAAATNSIQLKVHNPIPNNQSFFTRMDLRNDILHPLSILQLKEEHT